ncbi:hypothetical protein IQ276_016350 [Desmonostoc muscorum LEGE 12446]|uniref:Uncharacterized protein n=1 Tax=Desmonostoc muscorum LEGE 12446 TaxID=1828758 RepID=A0A8J6ZN69_DESMC|nr:hypothetical protein [Desmonostoc muscorum]MCF2147967.1 hypothetical protein [Desmonostoc muscorum LEGE 12446]
MAIGLKATDPLQSGQWYDDDTYYQILLIAPRKKKTEGQYLETTIVAQKRGKFKEYLLDEKTQKNLIGYISDEEDVNHKNIASYLPSPGVVFPKGFLNALFPDESSKNNSIETNNFYDPIRTLLHTRKISQLIAKTWHCYLEAKASDLWCDFVNGKWDEIDSDILDGLIAREIFFFDQQSSPDNLLPKNLDIYYPLNSQKFSAKTRFLILPSSKGWQGITLSLLMAGQAYYEITKDGQTYYHQISQPILSTGEIVIKYGLEVTWDKFKGEIKELKVDPGKSSVAYEAIIPYPPIPSEINLCPENITKWSQAKDEGGEFPFYTKDKDDESYLVGVEYFSPPYPYIPLSCT